MRTRLITGEQREIYYCVGCGLVFMTKRELEKHYVECPIFRKENISEKVNVK